MAPAGQLWSTVADLGRWAAFLAGDTGDLLTADSLAEMREPLVVDDAAGEPWTAAYGLGLQLWNVAGRRSFGHGGSMPGFLAGLRIDAETGDAVVTAANATTGLSAEVTADLLQIVAAESPVPAPAWTPAAVADEVLALVGPWYWGPAPLALHALPDGWLYLRPLVGKARSSRFRPEADGTWTGADGYYAGETLRVVRRDDGSASHLDVASFVLTRRPYDPEVDIPGGVAATGWR